MFLFFTFWNLFLFLFRLQPQLNKLIKLKKIKNCFSSGTGASGSLSETIFSNNGSSVTIERFGYLRKIVPNSISSSSRALMANELSSSKSCLGWVCNSFKACLRALKFQDSWAFFLGGIIHEYRSREKTNQSERQKSVRFKYLSVCFLKKQDSTTRVILYKPPTIDAQNLLQFQVALKKKSNTEK